MLVAAFAPNGPVVPVIDDTIERRRGPRISVRGIDRDAVGSSDLPQVRGRKGQPREWIYTWYDPRPGHDKTTRYASDRR